MDELISKQVALDLFKEYKPYMAVKTHEFGERLKALPSVQQSGEPTDEYEIVKEYCDSRCLTLVDSTYLQYLSNFPIVPHKQKWIPCNERLPEEHLCDDGYIEPSDYVLVWGDYGNYGVSRYWGNRRSKSESPNTYKDWMDLDWVAQKPIAWMPLPEPWRGVDDKK